MTFTRTRDIVLAATGLVVFAWVVRFWHFQDFGLYMDDLTRIPITFEMTAPDLGQLIANSFFFEGLLSRPLHASLIYTLSFLGAQTGRMETLYLISAFIYALNIILFFLFVRRIANDTVALLASFIFILFAADTTQLFLTQAFGIQPSITFLLLGFHAYLSGRLPIAYVLVFLSLLTYESAFIIFLIAPLLVEPPEKPIARTWARHVLILVAFLLFGFLLRYFEGDQELRGLGALSTLGILLQHIVIGPVVSLGSFIFRPIETFFIMWTDLFYALRDLSPIFSRVFSAARLDGSVDHLGMLQNDIRWVVLLALVILVPTLLWIASRSTQRNEDRQEKEQYSQDIFEGLKPSVPFVRLIGSAILMLILAYPLILVIPAYTIRGRNTRVHYAAVLGASLLVALLVYFVWRHWSGRWCRIALAGVAAVVIAFLIGSAYLVQLDYRNAWDYQQIFWRALLPEIEDVGSGEVVAVDPEGLIDSWQIEANTWNLPRVLPQLYDFPPEYGDPPRVYRLVEGWETVVGDPFVLDERTTQAPPSFYTSARYDQTAFVETVAGLPIRTSERMLENGQVLTFKQPVPYSRPSFPTTMLYQFLIVEE